MNRSEPLISIVIPCYNAEEWVGAAIQSVRDQGRDDVEIIVVDDGSKDNSTAVLRSLESVIRWEGGANRGACVARNRGLAMARGVFTLFLDADDYLEPGFLNELAVDAEDGVDLIVGGHVIEDIGGTRIASRRWPPAASQADLMLLNIAEPLQTGAFLWRTQFVRDHGGWDESLPIAQDTDFALRMLSFRPGYRVASEGSAHVVWRAVGGDARITTKMTDAKLKVLLDVFERHRAMLSEYRDVRIDQATARRFFAVARMGYAFGNDAIGRAAETNGRTIGVARTYEQGAHAVLTRLLGLRSKTKLLSAVYAIRYRSNPGARPYPYNLTPRRR